MGVHWQSKGIIILNSNINTNQYRVGILTDKKGLHYGISKQKALILGSYVEATWSARLETHMGSWYIDTLSLPVVKRSALPMFILLSACEVSAYMIMPNVPIRKIYEKFLVLLFSFQREEAQNILSSFCELENEILKQHGEWIDKQNISINDKLLYNAEFILQKSKKYFYRKMLMRFL